ncbi:MAG: hypothetical protein Kow00109_06600 [Acidobacteriota bacterium]
MNVPVWKRTAAVVLAAWLSVWPAAAAQESSAAPGLEELIQKSYVELFDLAPRVRVDNESIRRFERRLKDDYEKERKEYQEKRKRLEEEIEAAQRELKELNRRTSGELDIDKRRHELHCQIQARRKELSDVKLILDQGLKVKYENRRAKLEVLQEWPERLERARRRIEEGKAAEREFGDYQDVGFRGGPFEGQEEDIELGREALDELRRQDMLPPKVEDREIVDYVRGLAERIARHSDMRVPLQVTVLQSEEVNAFALPGGFIFVNTGLLKKAEHESELAGVLAHEIAHVAARHSRRLMGKANIANILFQAAQVAALILTGGASTLGSYYLLQYGFYGLGMVLDLSLLGVSREYELESDILGTQYLWHANYDVKGFIDFFGKMAEEEGYVIGMSWFRTHPPFGERMLRTYEEIVYLPEQRNPITDSEEFQQMKKRLAQVLKEMEDRDRNAPTLRRVYDCEPSGGETGGRQ